MRAFNRELSLCTEDQVDEFGYDTDTDVVVYAYRDDDILITTDVDNDNEYCLVVSHGGVDFSNSDRYDNLEDAQEDLLEELDLKIMALQKIRDALTKE